MADVYTIEGVGRAYYGRRGALLVKVRVSGSSRPASIGPDLTRTWENDAKRSIIVILVIRSPLEASRRRRVIRGGDLQLIVNSIHFLSECTTMTIIS